METFEQRRAKALNERYEKLRREDPQTFAEAVEHATALAHNHNWPLMIAAEIEETLVSFAISIRDRR